ncbi:guanine-1-methyltransferase-domain-containing protein [Sporodiniella umbellata]|nr:guanine-1-methyltransferase-domain-containing protein [Sporodiniella umbellata]
MSLEKSNIRVYDGKEYDITDPKFIGKSKNAIKRLLKDEIYNETKAIRTREKKEREKKRKLERRQQVNQGLLPPLVKKPRNKAFETGPIGVILDCAFSHLMTPKEMDSLRQQLARAYSANARAQTQPMQMTLTSVDEPLTKALDTKSPSWKHWKSIDIKSEPYIETFEKENLVYLTADSDQVIHELEEGKQYIVGAIVDKNRYKNLCKDKAEQQGIQTARLPIGEYIRFSSRKVLTINHVLEIMVKWLECRNWEEAFMKVIPERKLKESELVSKDSTEKDQEEKE